MAAAGRHVPPIENKPEVIGYNWLFEAFLELHTSRNEGFTRPGAIGWAVIDQYARSEGLNEEERYLLFGVVRHLDEIYRDFDRKGGKV